MTKVVVYTADGCPYCIRAKQLLDSKKVQYEEKHIEMDDQEQRKALEELSGRRTVPQIFINDQIIGGFDDLYALSSQGKLDELLK